MNYQNQAVWDRLLHAAVGLAMLFAGWWLWPGGILGAALRIFGLVPLVTGLIGWSPLYALLGWSTRHRHGPPRR